MADAARWDELVERSVNGTFLHTRRYLSYHGDRFDDLSLVAEDSRGGLRAVLPAARDDSDPTTVISHPGITYGGLVYDVTVGVPEIVDILRLCISHWRDAGLQTLHYRVTPHHYHRVPANGDLYGLFLLGAQRVSCGVGSVIDLGARLPVSRRRRRGFAKATQTGARVADAREHLDAVWELVTANLNRRYRVEPVHTVDEISRLAEMFPEDIRVHGVWLNEQLESVGVSFLCATTWHAQYLHTTDVGRSLSLLDLLIESLIQQARQAGCGYFSFGVSTTGDGRQLNVPLYDYKTSFGAGCTIYESYALDLRRLETGDRLVVTRRIQSVVATPPC